MVSRAEKYALEIEIVTLSRKFRAQIWRSGLPKRCFQRLLLERSGGTVFFNSIGRKQPKNNRNQTNDHRCPGTWAVACTG
ncbi:hypothetical protein CXB36_02625 [Pseudomonas syringae pv. syringae]|nr:hypothetical protein BKC06_019715 [Pseudomonas syringae pv. syringae]POP68676.1 hypothetical protein CXB36_02625 [Pseudomonas syringae pv. syringae]